MTSSARLVSRLFCLALFCTGATLVSASPLCTSGSLADYIGLNQGGGCQNGDLTFFRFSFSPAPVATGGAPLATASDIQVVPYNIGSQAGFFFSSSFFQLNSQTQAQSATYFLGYSVDPPPIILGDKLNLDPPFGDVTVRESLCANDVLVNSCGFGLPFTQSVTPASPSSAVYFPYAVPFTDVALQISLRSTPGNPAAFDAIQTGSILSISDVPEPSTTFFVLIGLMTVVLWGRRHLRA